MGYYAKLSDVDAPVEPDDAQVTPSRNAPDSAPVSGYVWRNGRAISFTLEPGAVSPAIQDGLREQLVIGALLLVSFIAPIFHLLG